jgi:hypothetical protein
MNMTNSEVSGFNPSFSYGLTRLGLQAFHFVTSGIEKYQVFCAERHVNVDFAGRFSFDRPHLPRLVNCSGSIRLWARCAIEIFPSPNDPPDVGVVGFNKNMHVTTSIGRRDHDDDIGTFLFAPVIPDEVTRFPIRRLATRRAPAETLVAHNTTSERVVR